MNKDGGWGWVIVAAAFLISFIYDGIRYSYGLLYLEFLAEFKQGKAATSWIGSIMFGILNIAGPITAVLINTFGCRTITITGTIVCFTGYIISVFAKSVYFLCLSMGLLGGVGLSMLMLPINVIIVQYFNKRRSLAMGLAYSGSGFGTIVFNPVSKWLIDEYGWRGTLLIEAGLLLNCGICGLQMKSFTSQHPEQDIYDKYDTGDKKKIEECLQLKESNEAELDTLDHLEDSAPNHIKDNSNVKASDTLTGSITLNGSRHRASPSEMEASLHSGLIEHSGETKNRQDNLNVTSHAKNMPLAQATLCEK